MARRRVLTPLRWSDMDVYGHVNNVQFLRLLEDARVVAFHGHDLDDGGSVLETGLLVARHEIDYLRPLRYRPAPIAIDLWVTALRSADFDVDYEVRDDEPATGGGPVVYARAQSTMVLYDLGAGRPRRFTAGERERLQEWRDEPVALRRRRPDAVPRDPR